MELNSPDEFDWLADRETDTGISWDWLADRDTIETQNQPFKPHLYARQVQRRKTIAAQKQENLALLIPTLPPPNEDLFILGTAEGKENKRTGLIDSGAFDFGSFIPHAVELLGNQGVTCYCSTWVLNRQHVEMFRDLLDSGRIGVLNVLSDPFFRRRHTAAICASLIELIHTHPPCRIKLFNNHAKILCLMSQDGQRVVTVQGSSNLTAVQRVENYHLSTAEEIYHFYVSEFFEPMLGKVKE